jgi:prepilin-type N-terminal cleavage/methylation domain-containing protein
MQDIDRRTGLGPRRRGLSRARAGLTLLEVSIALLIVCSVLTASASAFLTNISAVSSAQRRSRATLFLETVLEDLSAQDYDNLAAFDGNQVFDQATLARSNYTVDLTVFLAAVDLMQVRAVLTDRRTNLEVGRVTTLRSRR